MMQSATTFNHKVTAQHYIDLYEKMLQRPLVNRQNTEPHGIKSDRLDQQNIIRFSKKRRRIEEQHSKLLRVNQ